MFAISFIEVGHVMLFWYGIVGFSNIVFWVAFATNIVYEGTICGGGTSVFHLFLMKVDVEYICNNQPTHFDIGRYLP